MFPFLPSLPNHPQAPGCSGFAPQQQTMLSNLQQHVCNPCSQPNPVGFSNGQQIPTQLYVHNHQFQNPQMPVLNNQNVDNVHRSSMVMPIHPQLAPLPSLPCAPNIALAVQTSLMGMQLQQGNPCLHHHPQNLNQISALPFHGQICNVAQALNQLGVPQLGGQFGINSQMQNVNQVCAFPQGEQAWQQNLSRNLNQVTGLQGQFCSQNPIQPLNQIRQLSKQNAVGMGQSGSFNLPHSSHMVVTGHGFQNACLSNSILGPRKTDSGSDNTSASAEPAQGQNAVVAMAITSQNAVQNSLAAMQTPMSSVTAVPTKVNHMQTILPSDSVQPAQASHSKNDKNDICHFPAAKFGNSACRSFNRNHHGIVARDQSRFQKPNHHVANGGSFFKKWDKGPQRGRERKPPYAKYENRRPEKCQRRPVTLNYTEEEIKQWREARKRNFPTAANMEKRKHETNRSHEALDEDAKICRQQLKEVLAKQIELGFEAAEVPSHYLSGQENRPWERNGRKEPHVADRFRDKYGKRGRGSSEKWHSKRQKSKDEPSTVPIPRKKEPTLLQKLLSSEIKRDRSQLLQVFRFMTLNSFFEHWPDKPLEYPQVTVANLGCQLDCAKGKSLDSTASGVGTNFGAKEGAGQAEPGAGDNAEESADKSACLSVSDMDEEDTVHFTGDRICPVDQCNGTEDGEITG